MDTAVGLSLLIAAATAPPFGNGFMTFCETPGYISLNKPENSPQGLVEKVKYVM